ncbi:MAG: PKD domain-containing protein, partial [Bacteroidia bacterium]|nr:PKD domain-containing protein [Bacteroidia bacterium]
GGSNGTATVAAGGGTPGYTYLWNDPAPAQTTATCTGLTAGTWTVTVTDNNLCTTTVNVVITQPIVLTATTTGTPASCNGGANGSATVTPAGGTSPYSYGWVNLQTTQTAIGLAAGNYSVTVTDALLCTVVTSYTVVQPVAMTLTPSNVNATCGMANGSASIAVVGGTSPYTYLWSNAGTTNSIINVVAGAYTVTVTDNNGCTSTNTINVNNSGAPSANITASTNVSCNGGSNGSATVTAAGGTAPYTYLWNDPAPAQTTATATALTVGTWSVTVTDFIGCQATASVTITQPSVLSASITSQTNVSCNGGANGTATVAASGGTPGYTYLWNDPAPAQTTATSTALTVGSWVVTVTDINLCTTTATVNITQPSALVATISGQTNVNCNGGTNGTATVVGSGGTPGYTYNWSNSQSTAVASGLGAATYQVTVTDLNLCTATNSVTIIQPTALTANISAQTNVSCNGGANGTATVTAGGGTPGYTYLWNDPAPAQTTAIANSLTVGIWSVTVTDVNLCTAVTTVNITQPTIVTANITAQTNVSCNGGSNGTATVTAGGGTPGYTYLWDDPAPAQTTASSTALTVGTWIVTVTDLNLCTTTASVTITQPTALSTSISAQTNVSCNGGSNGTATVSGTGGTLPYTYLWNDPAPAQTSSTATGLTSGSWTVTVSDANLCTSVSSVTIIQPAALTASVVGTNVLCNSGATGTADLTVGGGTPSYTYNWSNLALSEDLTGLSANTYNVTVTDNLGCTITSSVVITQPSAVTVSITSNIGTTGFGLCDGSATAAGANGTPGYTYLWTSGSSTATTSGLCAGTYTVTVTDLNGCTATTTVTIVEPNALTVTIVSTTNVLCNGVCSGSATLSVSGGVAPYTYLWPNAQTTITATGLCAGSYIVTVTDFNGITGTATAVITEPSVVTSSIGSQVNVSCNGGSNGTATVAVGGGTAPYTYLWNDPAPAQTSSTATGLTSGSWTVTVSDANLCTSVSSVTIIQPALLTANIAGTNILCNGQLTGAADLTVLGGTSPFTYIWTTTATSEDLSGIAAGTYSVTVNDAMLCTAVANINIIQPTTVTATTSNVDAHCGQPDGSATVTPAGGTPGYTYNWSNSQTSVTATGLLAATYTVTVTDANSCSIISSVTVSNLAGGVATISASTPTSCFGGSNGTATVTMPGAVTYLWDNAITTSSVNNLNAGSHSVTVTDNNGCVSVASVTILQPSVVTSSVIGTAALCNGSSNGGADLSVSGGTPTYTYLWSNSAITEDLTNVTAGTYTVTATDANGCTVANSVTITQPTLVTANISVSTNVSCSGGTNGTASVLAGGGTPSYTYLWNGGSAATSANNTGFGAGNYTVTVTDSQNCSVTAFVTITQPTPISLVTSSVSENCGQNNGSATVVASGGTVTGGYTYNWSGGITPTVATTTGLSAGNYTVTVTDNNACTTTGTVAVLNIAPGTASISSFTNVTCNGLCNGTATVSVGGGVAPFIYLWSNGQTSATATGLCAGTYSVTATDANGCILNTTVAITQPALLANTFTITSPTCFGYCDGILSTSVTGGTIPYSYQWNDPTLQTTQNASLLCAGSYSVTIRDANNCTLVATDLIGQPPQIITSAVPVEAHCGQPDGGLTLTLTNGAAPFTYLWSNSANTQNLTGVVAGSYSVTVTDFKGCTGTGTFSINNLLGPAATISSSTNVSCFGQCDGVAVVNGTGGTSPYTYLWDNAQSSQTGTSLCNGVHSVTVTDAHNCQASANVTITQPLALILNTTFVAPMCNNSCNGTATTLVAGGTIPYSYNWTNNDHFATADSLCAGSYTIIVTDANLCTTSNTINVTQPAFVAVTMTSTPVLCNGACNGTATASPAGGIPPYTYLWNDLSAQTTQTATGLCAGSYIVSVFDSNGCLQTSAVTITQPTILTSSITNPTNISCFGGNNGSAQVVVNGGTPGYTFIWSNSQVTPSISNLIAGVYNVTVTDLNGCTTTTQVTLTEPPILSVSLSAVNESCFNSCNGVVNSSITGGTGPYTYSWTNAQSTPNINNLCTGVYSVTIVDSHSCSIMSTASVSGPLSLQVVVTSVTDADCGQPNGSATVSASGGSSSTYSYNWTPNVSNSSSINNVIAGAYTVTITDINGCTATTTVNVNNNLAPVITNIAVTNVSCFGGNNGTATVTYTNTTPISNIQWSDPMAQSASTAIGLSAGNYYVVITDVNGCTVSGNASIVQPPQMFAIINSSSPTLCYGSCDGSAVALAAGGTSPYSYSWSDPLGQNTQSASGLCAGYVSVLVSDANACTAMANTTINQPTQVQATGITTAVNCNGGSDGSITASQSGGTPGYSYNWMPYGGTTATAANLPAGTVFTVYVTDVNGCTAQAGFILSEPSPIVIQSTTSPATCNQDNGTAIANVNGGTPGYTYNWSPSGSILSSANNLAPGNHLLTIIDAHNCISTATVPVFEIAPPVLNNILVTNASCFGAFDGSAQVQIKFGTAPYSFVWSPFGGPDSISTNLSAGVYNVSVYDADGCPVITPPIVINQPTPVVVFANGSDSICIGQSITISASANGGTPGYTYQWNGGGVSQSYTVNPLVTTNYTVTATDSHGCTSAVPGNVMVYVNPPLNVTLSANNVDICQGQTSTINAATNGGNGGPYIYNWNVGSGNPNVVSPLTTTTYIVTVQDLCNSPSDQDTITINVHPLPTIAAPPLSATGCEPVVVTFNNVVNSLDSVSYLWNFGDPSSVSGNTSTEAIPTHVYETVGNYIVGLTLTTQYGCQLVTSYPDLVIVTPSPIANFYMYPTEVGLFDANIHFYDQSSYATTWNWNFGDGGSASVPNPQHEFARADTFNIILIVRGANGCMDTASLPLIIRDEHTFYAPTAFTPSAGLNNNFFYPKGMGFDPDNYYLCIIDRWGQIIFETTVYPEGTESITEIDGGWNGRYKNKGEIVPVGTYTWIVKMKDVNGLYHEYVGPVTVVR